MKIQSKISELFAEFVTQIQSANAMGKFDINTVSEDVLVPLLSNIYGYTNLRNLNHTEKQHYPGIDLADDDAKVAFQITSDSSSKKIKDSLSLFMRNRLYDKYDKVFFYILTQKQKSYSDKTFIKILNGKDIFSVSNILDYTDALQKITSLDISKSRAILSILEEHIGSGKKRIPEDITSGLTETSFLNLTEISFPDSLYIAELDLDISASEYEKGSPGKRSRKNPTKRRLVQEALSSCGVKFSAAWEVYENQLITFYNLFDESLPITRVLDKGTVSQLTPKEFYGINENYERVFKSLLRRCLQQQLYPRNVLWQNEEHLFIYSAHGKNKRTVKWTGQKESERVVFEKKFKSNKPGEVLNCKHFAFNVEFKQFNSAWFMLIKPEWFFSSDGYKQSFYSKDNIDWLKKRENNRHVFNHLRFIHYFLQHDLELFPNGVRDPFLAIGDIVKFNNTPFLNDEEWKPFKEKEGEGIDPSGSELLV